MLVLTRKTNQSIMIGDEVEVSVLAVSRDKIRLGITRPARDPGVPQGGLPLDPGGAGGRRSASTRRSQNGALLERVEEALDELSKD